MVPNELAAQRLDRVAVRLFSDYSRARLQEWIRQGQLTLNGKPARSKDKVFANDKLQLDADLQIEGDWQAEEIPLDVVFEDESLLVINKGPGFVVHPAPGHAQGTVVNAVLHHCPELQHLPRAGIVHRLDKDTTGIMVIAKSLQAHQSLVSQLQSRQMGREYEAIVQGEMTGGGKVNEPIGRDPKNRQKMAVVSSGKPAVTHYRLISRLSGFTHVRLKLETGRTHQIRVHMAHIRHPLIGDVTYAGRPRLSKGLTGQAREAVNQFPRQALHAKKLTLEHPVTGQQMSWEIDLPADMCELMNNLRESDATPKVL